MSWMKEPQCYKMLKEKDDGIVLGALKFPILFADCVYLLPKETGDKLVVDGWAELCKPKSELEKQMEAQNNARKS